MAKAWQLRKDERVFIAGQTGSGKTYFSRILTDGISRLVVVDPKQELDPAAWDLEPWEPRTVRMLERGKATRLHFAPDLRAGTDWDDFFARLYEIGNLTLYVDELNMTRPDNERSGRTGFHLVYQQGRVRRVRTIGVTQFPAYIPLVAFHQSEWHVCFRLIDPDHRDRMASAMGREVKEGTPSETWPDKHGFWYHYMTWPRSVYKPSVELEEPRRALQPHAALDVEGG